jgi:ferritin-like metal-binding protein YciE
MKMKTLHDLFVHELKDLHSAEKQLAKALPKMVQAATSDDLRQALEEHLHETQEHFTRLEQIFEQLEQTPRGVKCIAMEGLIEEGEAALEGTMDNEVRDATIICAAQKAEHYEIAGYGCARTFAEQLGLHEAARLLQQSLDEEKATDERLTQIATQHVNAEAAVAD